MIIYIKGYCAPILSEMRNSFFCNWAPRHESFSRSGGIAPRILEFDTRWRWLVSFTPRPNYLQWKRPRHPSDGRLGGPQSQSGQSVGKKNYKPRRESNPDHFVDSPPIYSESELCGGAVTASFSKYLSWQAMHFLQSSTHFWTVWRMF
jgi:hypothetical protein